MTKEWKKVENAANLLRQSFGEAPELAIILGSGLGTVIERMEGRNSISTHLVEGWPVSTVSGHAGSLHVGTLNCKRTLIVEGRVHLYEGYDAKEVVRPVRTAIAWGAKTIVLTNAAGGVDTELRPGQLMLIDDHINLTGRNPLVGPADDVPGPRFPDLSGLYDEELKKRTHESASELGIPLANGVYAGMLGPSYETAAEVRMLSALGVSAVGMSTVLEAVAAHHLGARVVGFSTITNMACGLEGAILDHDHVKKVGAKSAEDLGKLLESLVSNMEGSQA